MKKASILLLMVVWFAATSCATHRHSNMGAPGSSSESAGESHAESGSDGRTARGVLNLIGSPAQYQPTNVPR